MPIGHDIDVQKVTVDNDGRKVILCFKHNNNEFCIMNVYSPTQDHKLEQVTFITKLQNDIMENQDKSIIIGGDLNMHLSALDKYSTKFTQSKVSIKMKSIMEDFDLLDIWREHHPSVQRYTWRRNNPLSQSRLDYWFVTAELSYNISSCDVKPSIKSDHSLISLTMKNTSEPSIGKGLWKFNANLLGDLDYIEYMKGKIESYKLEYADFENDSLKWEIIKMDIRNDTTAYAITQAKLQRQHENELYNKLCSLSQNVDQNPNIIHQCDEIKAELEHINAIKAEGARIRSHALHIEDNEKCTKYFLNLEKRKSKMVNITKLKIENKGDITDPSSILNEQRKFYKNLYSSNEYDDSYEEIFFTDNIPCISEEDCNLCDDDITEHECLKALDSMKLNKSPGTDGLTVEFYQYFWPYIKDLVLKSILFAFNHNTLSNEQKRGVIRMIPKKGKDLTNLKNWRPITLLNTDYKILAQVLAKRLQKVLPSVISKDQNGYLENRFIGFNIRSILDTIAFTNNQSLTTIIAFLDFEKAFDKLNWKFMQKCLNKFGFGISFRKWVNILYTNIETSVINFGTTTKYFSPTCGIRQGCPLSALLFIIAVEILSLCIKGNKHIKGIKINGQEFKISQLADDATLFLNDICSLHTALSILYMFSKISGLKLNRGKTEILHVGSSTFSKRNPFGLTWGKDHVYALGSWFYKDELHNADTPLDKKINLLTQTLEAYSHRNLTWLGKICVIKSLGISRINFTISTLFTPEYFVKECKDRMESFFWNKKTHRIKTELLSNIKEEGGLKMTHLGYYIMAQKVIWIKRLLENQTTLPFHYLSTFLPEMKFEDFLKCSVKPKNIPDSIPPFYRQVLYVWFLLKQEPKSAMDFRRQVIWFNDYINIDGQMIFKKNLYEGGIVFVDDLFKMNGTAYTHVEFCNKYRINVSHLDYIALIDSIPSNWRKMLKCSNFVPVQPRLEDIFVVKGKNEKPVSLMKSKEFYVMLCERVTVQPTCKTKWNEYHKISFLDTQWKQIFGLPFILTKNTKIQEFQYKIIHRVYASDSYVSNFDKSVSKICNQCKTKNDIIHTFVTCSNVEMFWIEFETWYRTIDINNTFDIHDICNVIFGILSKNSFTLNFCILHAKWFIHCQKVRKQGVLFARFCSYLKRILQVEETISTKNKAVDKFNKELGHVFMKLM